MDAIVQLLTSFFSTFVRFVESASIFLLSFCTLACFVTELNDWWLSQVQIQYENVRARGLETSLFELTSKPSHP